MKCRSFCRPSTSCRTAFSKSSLPWPFRTFCIWLCTFGLSFWFPLAFALGILIELPSPWAKIVWLPLVGSFLKPWAFNFETASFTLSVPLLTLWCNQLEFFQFSLQHETTLSKVTLTVYWIFNTEWSKMFVGKGTTQKINSSEKWTCSFVSFPCGENTTN